MRLHFVFLLLVVVLVALSAGQKNGDKKGKSPAKTTKPAAAAAAPAAKSADAAEDATDSDSESKKSLDKTKEKKADDKKTKAGDADKKTDDKKGDKKKVGDKTSDKKSPKDKGDKKSTAAPTKADASASKDDKAPSKAFTLPLRTFFSKDVDSHATCASVACMKQLNKTGNNYNFTGFQQGRIVAVSKYAELAKACPVGVKQAKKLYAHFVMEKFHIHHWKLGAPQGYVFTSPVCGAIQPVYWYTGKTADTQTSFYSKMAKKNAKKWKPMKKGEPIYYVWPNNLAK